MTISKQRKDKRKKSHYNALCVAAVLEGLHPSWLPENNRGNLQFTRYEIDTMLRSIRDGSNTVYTQPRNFYDNFRTGSIGYTYGFNYTQTPYRK